MKSTTSRPPLVRGGGGLAPSTPLAGIKMPWGPMGSLGGDIDASQAAALAECITTIMAVVPNKKERCYP